MYNDYYSQNNGVEPLVNRLLSAWQQYRQPLTACAVGVGLAWVIAKVTVKVADKFKANRSQAVNEPLTTVETTAEQPCESTVTEPLETVKSTVDEPYTDEDVEREMMRQTMSLLGKRSAEARRLRKLNAE